MVYGYFSSATGNKQQMKQRRQAIDNYCKEHEYELNIYFGDTGSGLEIRKYLRMMLDSLQEGDIIVITDYSRLTRNMSKLYEVVNIIKNKGAKLEIIEQNIEDMDVLLYNDEIKAIAQRVLNVLK